jgi:hypothetical protein
MSANAMNLTCPPASPTDSALLRYPDCPDRLARDGRAIEPADLAVAIRALAAEARLALVDPDDARAAELARKLARLRRRLDGDARHRPASRWLDRLGSRLAAR